MITRANYKSANLKDISSIVKIECISIESNKTISILTLSLSNKEVSIYFRENNIVSIPFTPDDIFSTFELIHNKAKSQKMSLKVCGSCSYFGFTTMSFQFSSGKSGYCTLINGLKVSSQKGDVVHILDCCDNFIFRDKKTEVSPWLP